MKKILVISFIIFTLLFNVNSIFSYISNIQAISSYKSHNYKSSLDDFQNATSYKNSEKNLNKLIFNEAIALYKLKKFKEAKSLFLQIDDLDNDFKINHNLWNTFFRLWESESGDVQIEYWEKSLSSYENALSQKYDEETKMNYDFVEAKISELKKSDEDSENWEDQSGDPGQKEDWSEGGDNKESEQTDQSEGDQGGKQGDESWEQNSESKKWWGSGDGQDKDDWYKKLNEEEMKEIEKYTDNLNKIQKQNQSNFRRWDASSRKNDMFDSFFNDPFFNNGINQNGSGKDW
jgi:hypothetical protein